MELSGKRIAILAENLFEDLELFYPAIRLREAGAEVVVVGSGEERYTGKHGLPVKADVPADRVKAEDFDALVIPGGYSPDLMRRHKAMVDLVRDFDRQGKVVAAICHAGWMLASAGIARGRHVTCFHSIRDDVVNAGGLYEDREVVRDGNLVTSRQPDDLPAFCGAIIEAVAEAGAGARRGRRTA